MKKCPYCNRTINDNWKFCDDKICRRKKNRQTYEIKYFEKCKKYYPHRLILNPNIEKRLLKHTVNKVVG